MAFRLARLSHDNLYRWTLIRIWGNGPRVMFLGLNPSTADYLVDDSTSTRWTSFAKGWGYGSYCAGNLAAYRATSPADMLRAADPIGIENDHWLQQMASESAAIVACWGANATYLPGRAEAVCRLLARPMLCFGLTAGGHPKHPLYLPNDTPLMSYWHGDGLD